MSPIRAQCPAWDELVLPETWGLGARPISGCGTSAARGGLRQQSTARPGRRHGTARYRPAVARQPGPGGDRGISGTGTIRSGFPRV
jgi:hypothetical protein